MRRWLEFLGDACILTFSVFSLYLLVKLATHGSLKLVEPNPAILAAEIIVALLIFILFVERFVDDLLGGERLPTMTTERWKKLWKLIKEWYSRVS
jgi:hypothetical protein